MFTAETIKETLGCIGLGFATAMTMGALLLIVGALQWSTTAELGLVLVLVFPIWAACLLIGIKPAVWLARRAVRNQAAAEEAVCAEAAQMTQEGREASEGGSGAA